MKASRAPDVGDLVRANLDIANGFDNAIGLVVECRGVECYVLWNSASSPRGWWRRDQLQVFKSVIKP